MRNAYKTIGAMVCKHDETYMIVFRFAGIRILFHALFECTRRTKEWQIKPQQQIYRRHTTLPVALTCRLAAASSGISRSTASVSYIVSDQYVLSFVRLLITHPRCSSCFEFIADWISSELLRIRIALQLKQQPLP